MTSSYMHLLDMEDSNMDWSCLWSSVILDAFTPIVNATKVVLYLVFIFSEPKVAYQTTNAYCNWFTGCYMLPAFTSMKKQCVFP